MDIAASIIICTRNRADSLAETLSSIGRCEIPADLPTELLVIDNGSTDHTREVVSRVALSNMQMRYVHEPLAGQCYARNRGLAESRGDIFLYTDDDVRVPTNWVVGMCEPILKAEADAVVGKVAIPPDRAAHAAVAVAPFWFASTGDINEKNPERLVGANMAIGRQILKKVSAFDVELGPGAMGFHDETLFSRQLLAAGFRLQSAFDVAVSHHFDLSRVDRAALLDAANRVGRCEAYVRYHWSHTENTYEHTARFPIWLTLWKQRLRHFSQWWTDGAILPWEVFQIMHLGYASQLAIERKRPRNYEKNGLRKLCGVLPNSVSSHDINAPPAASGMMMPGRCA